MSSDLQELEFILEEVSPTSPTKNQKQTLKRKSKAKENSKSTLIKKRTTSKRTSEVVDAHPLYKKQKSKLKGMKASELHTILQKDFLTFCQDQGLVAKSIKCDCGNENMRLQSAKHIWWVCQKNGHVRRQGIKKGTLFENSHIPIQDILWIMYMWLYRYPTSLMMHECNNGPKTIIGLSRRCMDFCKLILEYKMEPLGGENRVVEIFECKFKDSELDAEEKWAFCALEQDSTKSLLIIMNDKNSDTILRLFDTYFLPGTLIVSMFWSPYTNVKKKDFLSLIRGGLLSFYDITTRVTMDTYEAFVKGVNKPQPLTHLVKNEYDASFFEKMYRKSLYNAPDAYLAFLKDVALICKPQNVIVKGETENGNEVDD